MEKSWNFVNDLTKQPVARKLAVGHLCVRQLGFWLLMVSSFNYFKMHAWSTSMLLLLHITFMLRVVKMLLKGEAGSHVLISQGKSWNCVFEFLWEPCFKDVFSVSQDILYGQNLLQTTHMTSWATEEAYLYRET